MSAPTVSRPAQRRPDYAARFLVRAAVTAPSVHNTQPWYFVSRDGEIDVHADAVRALPRTDPAGREMVISCGAALFNLRIAMRHLGFVPLVQLLPEPHRPDLLARVRWGRHALPTHREEQLFRVMSRRRTHRGTFSATPVPAALLAELRRIAREERADLTTVADIDQRRLLAQLIRSAESTQRADPGVAAELARWSGAAAQGPDGVGGAPLRRDSALFRDFTAGGTWGPASLPRRPEPNTFGVMVLLNTPGDRRIDWMCAGQALQAVLLHAAAHRVSAAFHTQPLEIPDLRYKIQSKITAGIAPQMILRLGYPTRTATSPRRPATEVLIEEP